MNKPTMRNNIVVCGLGNHAEKNILPAIVESKELNLYGVNTRNKDVLNAIAEKYRCLSFNDYSDVLNDKNVDISYLSTPPGTHYHLGEKALLSGKHLWTEKPITIDLKEAQRLIALASNKNLSLCEGLMYLYHPHFYEVKKFLNQRLLGDILLISSKFSLPKMSNSGFRFLKSKGGSCLYDVGIYPISLILNLFPKSEIIVKDSEIVFGQSSDTDISGSCILIIDSSIHCYLNWSYNVSYRNELDIWGNKSSLFTKKIFSKDRDYLPSLIISDSFGDIDKIELKRSNHFASMLNFFESTINDKGAADQQRSEINRLAEFLKEIRDKK